MADEKFVVGVVDDTMISAFFLKEADGNIFCSRKTTEKNPRFTEKRALQVAQKIKRKYPNSIEFVFIQKVGV